MQTDSMQLRDIFVSLNTMLVIKIALISFFVLHGN